MVLGGPGPPHGAPGPTHVKLRAPLALQGQPMGAPQNSTTPGGAHGAPFSKYVEHMPIHVFNLATIPGFPSFRVWPGTQDATLFPKQGMTSSFPKQGMTSCPKELEGAPLTSRAAARVWKVGRTWQALHTSTLKEQWT